MMWLAAIQVAIAAEPDVLSRVILYCAGAIVVGAMGWVIKVTRDVQRAITRLTDYLFGYTGKAGMDADVRALRKDVNALLGIPDEEAR